MFCNVHKNNPSTTDELKNEIKSFIDNIKSETLMKVMGNFKKRLRGVAAKWLSSYMFLNNYKSLP